MDFLNVSCGTLSVDINKKEMRQEKNHVVYFSNVVVNTHIFRIFLVVMNRLVSD